MAWIQTAFYDYEKRGMAMLRIMGQSKAMCDENASKMMI